VTGAVGGFVELAHEVIEGTLERDPVTATYLGDHRRDGLLPDPSEAAAERRKAQIRAHVAELAAAPLPDRDAEVDAEVLRTALAAEWLDLDEIREAEWNPMLHNPGPAVHALLTRPFAPLADRIAAIVERLNAVPEYLIAARARLATMSRCHLDTAVVQLAGTAALLERELPAAARSAGFDADRLAAAAEPAREAVEEHREWLAARVEHAERDPRLGEALFRTKLTLALDTDIAPDALLVTAESELRRVTDELVEVAGELAGVAQPTAETARDVLEQLGRDATDDASIVGLCRDALGATTAFVRDHDLVTVYDDPVDVVAMPEINRGVAAALCRESGPLEAAVLPTVVEVSPTPKDWDAERVASFYREYNQHLLHNLIVHEAMPGHALQLMHANRHVADTQVRAVFGSGTFIEGWAVYAEALMAAHGYRSQVSPRAATSVRMQQLKMALRTIINTILDIRFHCGDLDEATAMALMTGAGYQEAGEAAGKWRRVQLTSTQLCTYFVGATEVRAVAAQLDAAHPRWSQRAVHDAMLAHGSPAPRHLRTLLELPASASGAGQLG
jgi:uncharacterized protein (DUF885 family)